MKPSATPDASEGPSERVRGWAAAWGLIAACGCLWLAPAIARSDVGPAPDASRQRLQAWSERELSLLQPQLAHGPVALVEFTDHDEAIPAVHVATYVDAPAASVAALIADPATYPSFMRTLDAVEVLGRHGSSTVYAWRWQLGVFELAGRNVMTTYMPPPDQAEPTYRINVESTHGDLGIGRMLFKVQTIEADRCLLTVSMRMDLRDANYITRKLSKAWRSINRSANLALCFTLVSSLRAKAEDEAGSTHPPAPAEDLVRPTALRALRPLLRRGDLLLLRVRGEQLDQVAVLGRLHHPPEKVREMMLDTQAFGASLLPGSRAERIGGDAQRVEFSWGIGLPLVGVSGKMRMQAQDDQIAIDAIAGAFKGGRWRFETPAEGRSTVLIGWARFDLHDSGWLLERLVNADPYLGHGLSAASQVMLVRALRARLRKAQQQPSP